MKQIVLCCLGLLACLHAVGCATMPVHHDPMLPTGPNPMPHELSKVSLPSYVIEPPDILVVEALHIVPKPPYRLRTGDIISIQVQGTLPDAPLDGNFAIEPGGVVDLGIIYGGKIRIGDMSADEARMAIDQHLRKFLREPIVSVSLVAMSGMQQIAGEHLVGPDGSINLGSYGSVRIVGQTLAQSKRTIEAHLSQYLESPEVAVDVVAYNSKVYYIITQGAGLGDGVVRLPVTGNETVLDAIANINGLTEISSKKIWIARPTMGPERVQILPVNWQDITAHAGVESNYQLMPGDRLFIAQNELIALDTGLGKLFAPFERVMGFTLLYVNGISRFSGNVLTGGGLRGAAFGGP